MSELIQLNNLVTDSVIVSDSLSLDNEITINVPFPPKINPCDLITMLPDGNVPTRTPNAFIIYRKALIEAVRAEGHNLPMSSISSIASKQWYKEPENVKSEYKRLAIEAFNYSNTIIKSNSISRRRKNERWNTITFNNNSMTSRKDPKRPKKLSKNSKVQSSSRRNSTTPENVLQNTTNDIVNDNINLNTTNVNDTINDEHTFTSTNNNIIANIIGNINDTNNRLLTTDENLLPLPADWDEYSYQSPEIVSISNNDCLLEDNLDVMLSPISPFNNQNFSDSFVNTQQILTEVPHQNIWLVGNGINNGPYYYDTNLTCQFDKNVNDGLFVSEFPYIDTGKLCLDTIKNYNIAI
ncbi:5707_t:CDS:1 [Cetraspora pellucida]|uniref:5707_t:CDS:1 n=1 Tax=Cetraspora pellucida TaxID=1433469 RepID=A0A9N8VFZ2_9GLOM|nr:5707_t:CDS:1 [Cetraspora pellucida]